MREAIMGACQTAGRRANPSYSPSIARSNMTEAAWWQISNTLMQATLKHIPRVVNMIMREKQINQC